ncbi:IS66 family insertion sequence element accessory protein TnpA [Desulfolucanica intricata]|uniref:IS66 family insertion sequence element accessory protein TnpA n=1 Tax=Desulfolucanica intricata TaxID=1285191 RepID=UPI000835CA3E|nr:hypothetical protein [Desulfolucanica intricata]
MKIEEKQALVAECRASGMTAKAWCELKGIKYSRYCGWATTLNRKCHQDEPQQWADVTVAKAEYAKGEIKLNCGKLTISVEPGFNPTLLADILKVVNAVC